MILSRRLPTPLILSLYKVIVAIGDILILINYIPALYIILMLQTFPFRSYTDLIFPQSKNDSGANPLFLSILSWIFLRLISSENGISTSTQIIDIIYNTLLRKKKLAINLFLPIWTVSFILIIRIPSWPL